MEIDFQSLALAARGASKNAYCKFSKFAVGTALLTANGRIFTGCNIENSSYGLAMCAERVALYHAVAEGATKFAAIAIYTPTDAPTAPCGACRQVLAEFAPEMTIQSSCDGEDVMQWTLAELLPAAFRLDDR